jgi:hypothetical protein
MPDGEDFIMGPVVRGLCKYESLLDGALTLVDIGRMNDAIAVFDENSRRMNNG